MFDGLTQLVHIFFFFFISYFLHVGFFFYVFFFLLNLFNYYIFFYTTLQPNPHPRLLDLVLQSNPLKHGLCKFNVIINIINITLGSDVAAKSKT
jgi:hypothetical protein